MMSDESGFRLPRGFLRLGDDLFPLLDDARSSVSVGKWTRSFGVESGTFPSSPPFRSAGVLGGNGTLDAGSSEAIIRIFLVARSGDGDRGRFSAFLLFPDGTGSPLVNVGGKGGREDEACVFARCNPYAPRLVGEVSGEDKGTRGIGAGF